MSEFTGEVQANMGLVLDQVCAGLPNGGDHESRRYVAEQLIQAVRAGKTTVGS